MPAVAPRRVLPVLLLAASVAAAAPAPYTVLSDALDPNAPAATLPAGPVEQALAELAAEQPQAKVLVPLRRGARDGQPHALAAWQTTPGAKDWDALLVVATPAGARRIEITSTSKDREAVLEALIALGSSGQPPAIASKPVVVAPAAALPMPRAWDLRYVVLYTRRADHRPGEAAAEAALTEAHLQYALRLQEDGVAVAAGPFDAEGARARAADDAPIAMTLLRVRDRAAAEALAAADPAVLAGRLRATVHEWRVPGGRLP